VPKVLQSAYIEFLNNTSGVWDPRTPSDPDIVYFN